MNELKNTIQKVLFERKTEKVGFECEGSQNYKILYRENPPVADAMKGSKSLIFNSFKVFQ